MVQNVLFAIVVMIMALIGIMLIVAMLTRRAVAKVVDIFYRQNALRIDQAKTIDELGLRPPDFMQKLMRPRDYKQYALRVLVQKGIVCTTEDGKLYLREEKLDEHLRHKTY